MRPAQLALGRAGRQRLQQRHAGIGTRRRRWALTVIGRSGGCDHRDTESEPCLEDVSSIHAAIVERGVAREQGHRRQACGDPVCSAHSVPGCHHRPAWRPVSPDHRGPGDHPAQALSHGPQPRSRVAVGDERSELALDGGEDRATRRPRGWSPRRRWKSGPGAGGPGGFGTLVLRWRQPGSPTVARLMRGHQPHTGYAQLLAFQAVAARRRVSSGIPRVCSRSHRRCRRGHRPGRRRGAGGESSPHFTPAAASTPRNSSDKSSHGDWKVWVATAAPRI